ncbi:sensor histidine kinase [Krasilnikoviella flava]|uniref:histidine kinase n=1 Tax=Krasilnikoviella flava TaxID=526729 RepID=A0A1T5J993_9MICO|nr:sensor histidine kinase [Krasilnikoviella flava]SKC47995.1 Signal transduction histidine kinase [Krasilnikoviella flava]
MDRGPLDRWRPRLFLATTLAVVVTFGTLGASHWQPGTRAVDALGLLLALVGPVVLLALPRHPVVAVLLAVGALGTYLALGYAWGPVLGGTVGVLVMVLLTGPPARARAIAWSGAVLMWGSVAAAAALRDEPTRVAALLGGAAWTAVALLIATGIRERLARAAALRAARVDRERTAVATERLRIARELHDVLAHSLSAINVQAGVGLHLLDRDVEQARSALASIKTTSRDALDEVRAVLGVVRGEDAGPDAAAAEPRTPTWDLAALPRLAEPLQARGVVVRFDVDPALLTAGAVPAHLAGVAFRVVQEALTNVGRHAPGARTVVVHADREDGRLRVAVSDDGGPAGPPDENRPGYGLRGMRERVEGVGGTLAAGPVGDGFVVDATIPLDAAPATDRSGPPHGRPDDQPDDLRGDA